MCIAACLAKHIDQPATRTANAMRSMRKERTAAVVRKSHENRKQAFNPELAERDEAVGSLAETWQQSLKQERLDWLYTYDVTTLPI